ncbi:MAG TPA: alpha/beta fold hydrolase [Vicinamibacterales bacterium]|nr:alpha/beta fold hydrolase [Vicinamibacterales bacterium]
MDIPLENGRAVTARRYPAARQPGRATLILAHGAGAGQASGFMVDFAAGLSARGLDVVTFNFPYIDAGRRLPDPNAVLEVSWRAVIAAVAREAGAAGIYIGGKSMGGRIASQVAAQPRSLAGPLAGLVFLGYPLHPPGKPAQRRDAHLPEINRPMLFVQGERDAFGTADEMRALVERLPLADLHLVPGANHSLDAPKRFGRTRAEVFADVQDRILAWIDAQR